MLGRWVEESCAEYDLDDAQKGKVRERMLTQWSEFLTENRSSIQPLANEFIEMRLDIKPPDKDRVQAWADRAIPVFDKAREQVTKSHETFREVMRPGQRLKFEADVLQMSIGMHLAEEKLKAWKQGDIDKDDVWEGAAGDRDHRREVRRRRIAEQQKAREDAESRVEKDQIVLELSSWEKYVADFVVRFSLDQGQRDAAKSFLTELKERAIAHRDRHRAEITEMESQILKNNGQPEEVTEIRRRLQALYGPIDDMFKELKDRLSELPTSTQRAAVKQDEDKPAAIIPNTGAQVEPATTKDRKSVV